MLFTEDIHNNLDGAVNTIHIRTVLFYGGRETGDNKDYFLEKMQWCAIYQDW